MKHIGIYLWVGFLIWGWEATNRAAPAAAQQPKREPEPVAASAPSGDPGFRWIFTPGQKFAYDFQQTVRITSSRDGAREPLQVEGQFELIPRSVDQSRVVFTATHKGKPAAAAPVEATREETGPSCGCPRQEQKKPAVRPDPTPRATAMRSEFLLDTGGDFSSRHEGQTGQTELMARLAFPIPTSKLEPGKNTTEELVYPGVARRIPLRGERTITYLEDVVMGGVSCAHLQILVVLKGDSPPQATAMNRDKPGAAFEGNIELKYEGSAWFDRAAGRYVRSTGHTWMRLNTGELVNGQMQAVTVDQEHDTSVRLRE